MTLIKILILIVVFGGPIQTKSPQFQEKITWEEGDLLTWMDFKAHAPKNSKFNANSNTGISYSWGIKKTGGKTFLSYSVAGFFFPELSWVKQGSENDYLLQHEQTHFDITELHARKLRKELSAIKLNTLDQDARKILNDIYNAIEEERSAMQRAYDRQTNHSLNKGAEGSWQKLVKEELIKLREYRN